MSYLVFLGKAIDLPCSLACVSHYFLFSGGCMDFECIVNYIWWLLLFHIVCLCKSSVQDMVVWEHLFFEKSANFSIENYIFELFILLLSTTRKARHNHLCHESNTMKLYPRILFQCQTLVDLCYISKFVSGCMYSIYIL